MSENENEMEYVNYLGNILVYLKSLQSLADLLRTKLAVISVSHHLHLTSYPTTVYTKC